MEIAKTPYKSIYMTVPKTKFSKFSESIYEDGYFETQSCEGKTRFVSLYIKYDCCALRRAFLNRSKVLKSLRLKLFIYHLILVSPVL